MENKLVRNPKHTAFEGVYDCEVYHVIYGWTKFTASANDVEEHGRNIHKLIEDGEAGEIAPYSWEEHWANDFAFKLNELQVQSNVSNQKYDELTTKQKSELAKYRELLSGLVYDGSDGEFVNWPEKPSFLE